MPFKEDFIVADYFPKAGIPFASLLTTIFFTPIGTDDHYLIHGPNVVRLMAALLDARFGEPGLVRQQHLIQGVRETYGDHHPQIVRVLHETDTQSLHNIPSDRRELLGELLLVAALYHDVGKAIRRANHPQIGTNLIRNSDEVDRKRLVDGLVHSSDSRHSVANANRFSLISSLVQHHDKFGVVSTGEGALPIFSDILYFRNDPNAIAGIKKNVTSVMVLNLADIAAVNLAPKEIRTKVIDLARQVNILRQQGASTTQELTFFQAITAEIKRPDCCMGLTPEKTANVLSDWKIVIDAIDNLKREASRGALKTLLLKLEANPSRAIGRILRLLHTVSSNINAEILASFISSNTVESALVGILGAHEFQSFCEQLATIAKFDYGLSFFSAVMCASLRLGLGQSDVEIKKSWEKLEPDETKALESLPHDERLKLADRVTILLIRILQSLIGRYSGVLNYSESNARRFGFQMRTLTLDNEVRQSIIKSLCVQDQKQPIALTWIADEVTIWSMD